MDDVNNVKSSEEDSEELIPLDDKDLTVPFDDTDDPEDTDVSHSPLILGGTGSGASAPVKKTQKTEKIVSTDQISGVKTFFTKLHVGTIDFLDNLINTWLAENPGIKIKQTNTTTGMIVGKKTEPNIIVTIWY